VVQGSAILIRVGSPKFQVMSRFRQRGNNLRLGLHQEPVVCKLTKLNPGLKRQPEHPNRLFNINFGNIFSRNRVWIDRTFIF
jgi:hypothetical protein